MKNHVLKPFIWFSVFILIVSMGCLSSSKPTATPEPPPVKEIVKATEPPPTESPTEVPPTATEAPTATQAPTAAPAATEPPPPTESGAVSSLEDLQSAVIQIESNGTFEYPEGTGYNEAGRGLASSSIHLA